ncbi:DUF1643 domain-containing protein [Parageobacillus toebii]|uniref:DUF1643 domain-containing protein n=1 Tax=Parageobacillus toebii TaxID=153151 RepID=UPI002E21630F|nr:DUF1643 domain-containing protein [Parageobacillus toebii]
MVQYNPKYVRKILECQYAQLTNNIQARYLLSIELKNDSNEIATFVMMNPSRADYNTSDVTVNKVIKFAFIKGKGRIGIINIVNLFPFYETNSNVLQSIINRVRSNPNLNFKQIMARNNHIIKKAFQTSDYIIFAWGNPSKNIDKQLHLNQCSIISSYVKTLNPSRTYVIKTHHKEILTKGGYPRHPSRPALNGFKKCVISENGKIII